MTWWRRKRRGRFRTREPTGRYHLPPRIPWTVRCPLLRRKAVTSKLAITPRSAPTAAPPSRWRPVGASDASRQSDEIYLDYQRGWLRTKSANAAGCRGRANTYPWANWQARRRRPEGAVRSPPPRLLPRPSAL